MAFPFSAIAYQQIQFSAPPRSAVAAPLPSTPNPELAAEEALKKQQASLEQQRQAIQKQLADKGALIETSHDFFSQRDLPLASLLLNQPDCPALNAVKVNELISAAAHKDSLDPALLKAIMRQESGFKPCAISIKGAQGLMQLMPATARELHVNNVFDPAQNVQAGAAYLKQLLGRYKGDLRLALAGYNAGPSRADQGSDAPLPLETQNYIANIFADLGIDQSGEPSVQEDLAPPDDVGEETAPAQTGEGKTKLPEPRP
jgi:soluble lytic murein transglycosylase-like protein